MAGLPTVTIVGTCTSAPELRFTASGAAVATWTVAANDRKFNRDTGKYEDAGTTFLRCSIWRQAAENCAESLSKGDRVVAIGQLRQREYEKDGEKRTVYELDVDEVAPSLRFATATVNRVKRGSEQPQHAGADDPWSTPQSGGFQASDGDSPF
jgi:single-strand DNA-binding protein